MGWAIGYDGNWERDIGYGVPAVCDHPECNERIDRGLGCVCANSEPYGGENGCGLYFCSKHRVYLEDNECCKHLDQGCVPKPDLPEWIDWKLTDESWQEWRDKNPDEVKRMQATNTGDAPP
ncbi:MAG TPA: hypothetical protein VJU83_09650 [Burkholderiales bacterium]|nr:hypothetical protein [Burkholderiales bacterium]